MLLKTNDKGNIVIIPSLVLMKNETLERINPIFAYIVKRMREENILGEGNAVRGD